MSDERVRVGIVGPGWWSETMFVPAVHAHDLEQGFVLLEDLGRDPSQIMTMV